MIYYAGIGSRKTPPKFIFIMRKYAQELEKKGYILRSGGAAGADSAFEAGVTDPSMKRIFRVKEHIPKWCFEEALKYIPSNRPDFRHWKEYIRRLIARNMMQILGEDIENPKPVEFVLCYTPTMDYKDGGGTGYAIRCAQNYKVPVYNLFSEEDREVFEREYL